MNIARYNARIGTTIRQLRQKRKWSQLTLARKIGVDQSTISNYESAKTECTLSALILLKGIFGEEFDCVDFPSQGHKGVRCDIGYANNGIAGERVA